MKKDRYFMDQAKKYGPMTLEKCFENMTIDPILMKDIERQGVFSKNQKHYLHEMISKHSKKCTFYTLRFGCSFAAVNTIKPQLL